MDLFIRDGKQIPHPETMAMLQALYSRNPGTILEKEKDALDDRSGAFLDKWYVGYGDDSIGDCGTFTFFIEGVSMLAAKVVQHHPLYNGQEASTRYLDFSKQGYIDPLNRPDILQMQVDKYFEVSQNVYERLLKTAPLLTSTTLDDLKVWQKACKARAFDIARGFLPCGMKTSLSWMTTIRNARDHIMRMATHPAKEPRALAHDLYKLANGTYPKSFKNTIEVPELDYFEPVVRAWADEGERYTWAQFITTKELDYLIDRTATERLRRQPLHTDLDSALVFKINWTIDFASFRDLQRHRNQKMPLPIVDTENGTWESWYLEEANIDPTDPYIQQLEDALGSLVGSEYERQYYAPMMTHVYVPMVMTFGQVLYLIETRSSRMVHSTLRRLAIELGETVEKNWPKVKVHIDRSQDEINMRRGKQDIVRKETV